MTVITPAISERVLYLTNSGLSYNDFAEKEFGVEPEDLKAAISAFRMRQRNAARGGLNVLKTENERLAYLSERKADFTESAYKRVVR